MLLIFDWDGTLLDSTGKIVTCMQRAIADVGMPSRSEEETRQIIGLGLPEAVRSLYPEVTSDQLLALRESYSRHYMEADQTPCPFYPQVEHVLQYLKKQGHQLAVATGKSRRGLNRVLENVGMTDFFHATRCADETASKPDPRMLFELLAELKHLPEQALMIGDTEFDLMMAKNAGINSIAVTYGAHQLERLHPCEPLACVDEFVQLLDWVDTAR